MTPISEASPSLTVDQKARAAAALGFWFTSYKSRTMSGAPAWRAPARAWEPDELQRMWAAIDAPTTDEALIAFGAVPGTLDDHTRSGRREPRDHDRDPCRAVTESLGRMGPGASMWPAPGQPPSNQGARCAPDERPRTP
jgi:hypothetical protein